MEEFIKIRQDGSVEEYQDKFEELRVHMERVMPHLRKAYFLSVFIGGLKDEIRSMLRMIRPIGGLKDEIRFMLRMIRPVGGLKDEIRPMLRMIPTTLSHAFEIARFQEQLVSNPKKTQNFTEDIY